MMPWFLWFSYIHDSWVLHCRWTLETFRALVNIFHNTWHCTGPAIKKHTAQMCLDSFYFCFRQPAGTEDDWQPTVMRLKTWCYWIGRWNASLYFNELVLSLPLQRDSKSFIKMQALLLRRRVDLAPQRKALVSRDGFAGSGCIMVWKKCSILKPQKVSEFLVAFMKWHFNSWRSKQSALVSFDCRHYCMFNVKIVQTCCAFCSTGR